MVSPPHLNSIIVRPIITSAQKLGLSFQLRLKHALPVSTLPCLIGSLFVVIPGQQYVTVVQFHLDNLVNHVSVVITPSVV